jgi:hypothetical protein
MSFGAANLWPRRFAALIVGVLALTLGPVVSAGAQGQAIQSLPGCTAAALPNGDDDSSAAVPLGFTANFFGKAYTSVYVNQNGNVTFDSPLSTFTPFDLASSPLAIIAPFFADVDASPPGSGQASYGQTTVSGRPAFCVNWIGVGYYSDHTDKTNDFQLLLVSQPGGTGDFDIVFNYNGIQWETGDASGGDVGLGGTSAAAGYSNGDADPTHSLTLPGSLQNGGFLDTNTTTGLVHQSRGSTQPGRDVFQVRNPKPAPPKLGKTVAVSTVSGTVLVKLPGSGQFVDLNLLTDVPVGSIIDSTKGTVKLTSAANASGLTQSAEFMKGIFKVVQKPNAHGRTDLLLTGGRFGACHRKSSKVVRTILGETVPPPKHRVLATTARKRRNQFRTGGKYAAATVRGTKWGTVDRCDGTLTRVRRGTVSVQDFVRHKTLLVHAGHTYLARAPGQ